MPASLATQDQPQLSGAKSALAAVAPQNQEAPSFDPITDRNKKTWTAGAFERIATGYRDEAAAFIARRQLRQGQLVLDLACGSGNLTIPAARTGARVTGLDIAPNLLAAAAEWAQREDLSIQFDEGNVESLPYADKSFEVVTSMFGVMFSPRPERVLAELARVTKPGGQVALANWTRRGFIGEMLSFHTSLVPPPPNVPSPLNWGDEKTIAEWFGRDEWDVSTTPRVLTFDFPHTPAGTVELFRAYYGPTVRAFAVLDEDGRASLAAALTSHWTRHSSLTSKVTRVDAEYLEVIAVRR
jgi:SAM-dependent methyltransferase